MTELAVSLDDSNAADPGLKLTASQSGMLFQALFGPERDVNYEQLVIGGIATNEAPFWRRAWQLAYERFDALRSSVRWEGVDVPVLFISEPGPVPWEETSGNTEALELWLQNDRLRNWNLAQPPLMRVTWFDVGNGFSTLIWSFHHVLVDGRSIAMVIAAIQQIVDSAKAGIAPPDFPIADYAMLLRALAARDASSDREFWRSYLSGFQAPNNLPGSRAHQDLAAIGAPNLELTQSELSLSRVIEAADRHGLTLGTVVQAAWALLVSRTVGEDDVVFGLTRAGRHFHPRAQAAVGMFMVTIPMRCQVAETEPLVAWLRKFRQATLAVREHEHYSLAEIQALTPIRSGTDLFDSLIAIDRNYLNVAKSSHASWANRTIQLSENAGYPLVLSAHDADSGRDELVLTLTADISWIEPKAARRAFERLGQLLESLVAALETNSDVSVGELEWLPAAEREAIDAIHPSPLPAPKQTIDELFEAQAALTPERTAVVAGDARITYRELDRRSNQLARILREEGVVVGDFVAVCLDRSVEMIVALVAVLKAGAAYVPLDRFFPKLRIASMLEQSKPKKLLSVSRLQTEIEYPAEDRLHLDELSVRWEKTSSEPLIREHNDDSRCYLIFTSGTTGQPKGVQCVHRNLTSIFFSWSRAYHLEQHTSHLQMASFSFDVFAGDFARALLSGGKLVLCEPEKMMNPPELAQLMLKEQVDIAEFVPLVLRALVDHLEQTNTQLPALKTLIAGSDVWYISEYRRIIRLLGDGVRLINSYGVTECTIDTTYFEGRLGDQEPERVLPIGIPFDNSRVRILVGGRRLAGFDETGELWIGGHGVTLGYLGRDLGVFVTEDDGERWYRSGDVASLSDDGTIQLVGRSDSQVKVQGYRVELGEVEAALVTEPSVAQCVVATHDGAQGERYLVAYLVPSAPNAVNVDELRYSLGRSLPYYMIPSIYMQMDALPRTAIGKVDRKALPTPSEVNAAKMRTKFVAPATDLEERLAAIWRELLGVEAVGRDDNFFDLGGHSLLAVRLLSRVNQFAEPKLPLFAMLNASSVAALAALIESKQPVLSGLVPLTGGPEEEPALFFVHTLGGGGGGGFYRYQLICKMLEPGRRCYGIRAPAKPLRRVEDMAALYITMIRQVQPKGPYSILGFCFGGMVAYEMARQLRVEGETVGLVALIDATPHASVHWPVSPREVLWFLRNLCYCILGFLALDFTSQLNWLRSRLMSLFTAMFHSDSDEIELQVGEFLESHEQEPEYRPYVEAHWAASTHYEPQPYAGQLLVVRSRYQPLRQYYPALGWELHCDRIETRVVPCAHSELLDAPASNEVARVISAQLEK